jgi:hypothetical protein
MNPADFDALVAVYLEGGATKEQVARLRSALGGSEKLTARFQSLVRLHRAQVVALGRREDRSFSGVTLGLQAYAQRCGRFCAHLCLLALVLVQLQVTIPAQYSGLLWYMEPSASTEPVIGATEMPALSDIDSIVQETDFSQLVESAQPDMPNLVLPEPAAQPDGSPGQEVRA